MARRFQVPGQPGQLVRSCLKTQFSSVVEQLSSRCEVLGSIHTTSEWGWDGEMVCEDGVFTL